MRTPCPLRRLGGLGAGPLETGGLIELTDTAAQDDSAFYRVVVPKP